MQTTVGVFAARERAEEAVRRLLEHHVPEERILYLTRTETDAKSVSRQFGIHASGLLEDAAPASASVATPLLIPGVGPVFALGTGAAAFFGLAGAGAAAAEISTTRGSAEDLAFFRRVLSEGHSVIIVRTDSSKTAAAAGEILDTLGLSMKKVPAAKGDVAWRQLHGAVILDFSGKIAFAEGSGLLRDTVQTFLGRGHNRILLNLEHVDYIDSVGLGELVRTEAAVRGRGGQLKLVKPNANVHHLLRLTKLDRVFDIAPDEFTALQSFRAAADTKPSA